MAEWEKLFTYLGGDSLATIAMRKDDPPLWNGYNEHTTNKSGFSAIPGGRRQRGGEFGSFFIWGGHHANFWATDEFNSGTEAITISSAHFISRGVTWSKNEGFSCRCIKDN